MWASITQSRLPGRAWASLRGALQELDSQAGGRSWDSVSVGMDGLGPGIGAATEKGLMSKTGII